jgi:hypothetical protein
MCKYASDFGEWVISGATIRLTCEPVADSTPVFKASPAKKATSTKRWWSVWFRGYHFAVGPSIF